MSFIVEGLTHCRESDHQVRRIGEYATLEEALAAARRAIDEFLAREFAAGMLPSALFARYQSAGEVPFIFRNDVETVNVPDFNHIQYARARCSEICVSRRSELGELGTA